MKKKIFAILLVVAIVASLAIGFTACGKKDNGKGAYGVKVGLICLHGETSTYDANFINAMKATCKELGLGDAELIIKTGIPEDNTCYDTAADLVDQGCDVIFADSFGHEPYMIKAAKEFTDVEFCHATGTHAHTENLPNFHNSFASIYEGRYIAGVVAGMKLNEMAGGTATGADAKMGYVGAFPYAEVVSGLTAFYLGAKSVCPAVTMEVKYTSSWYDLDKEYNTATDLINAGCKLIGGHADSMGAPNACKENNVPNVTYNVSTKDKTPNTYLVGCKINWAPYFKYMIESVKNDTAIATDWVGTTENGAVEVLELGNNAPDGAQDKINEVKAAFANGSLKVFDVSKFTVKGETISSFMADVDDDGTFSHEKEVIKEANGIKYIAESEFRSAPYFDLQIDGITFPAK